MAEDVVRNSMIHAKYLIISVLFLFLSLGLVLGYLKQSREESIQTSVNSPLEVSEKSLSWGEIDYDGGKKIAEFAVKNIGNQPVMLSDLRTSCMCTEVIVLTNQSQSPNVRMIDNSRWKSELYPNEIATVQVIFDPAYHGSQGLGDIKRIITLKTNAQDYEQLEFTVDGTVIKK